MTEHLRARVEAVKSFFRSKGNLTLAVDDFNSHFNKDAHHPIRAAREFIDYNVNKFEKYGTVLNRDPPGREAVVPDIIAKDCSGYLKEGYWAAVDHPEFPFGNIIFEHLYFNSINQACRIHPLLAQTLLDFDVSEQYLLRRMYEVDPNLILKTLHYKQALTPQQQQKRQECAVDLLSRHAADPTFFLGVCYADECKFVFMNADFEPKMYCDVHDYMTTYVLPCKHMKKGQIITVHVLVIVNAELGLCRLEFTTGTSQPFSRLHIPDKIYMVSTLIIAMVLVNPSSYHVSHSCPNVPVFTAIVPATGNCFRSSCTKSNPSNAPLHFRDV